MNTQTTKRNIPLMYAIAFFQGIVLYASISTLFRQARGLTLAQFAIIDGFSYIFQLAFEIPFGMLADRIGYKKTLILSNAFYFLSKLVFWQAYGFGDFLLERLLFSIALAGLSGVDSSILYLSAGVEASQKVFSHAAAFGTSGMLTGCLIFTLFLSNNYDAAALGTVLTYGIAFLLSFFITDVKDASPKDNTPSLHRLTGILKLTLKDRRFLLFILAESMLSYATWAITVMLNQPKYISLGLTEQHIGWIEIAFSALALTGAWSAILTKKMGFRKFMVTGITVIAASAIVMGLTGSILLAILSVALVEIAYALLSPLVSDLYSKHVTVFDRATQLSIYAMITEFFSFTLSLIMSLVTAQSFYAPFFLCAGMAFAGICLFLCCYGSKDLPTT